MNSQRLNSLFLSTAIALVSIFACGKSSYAKSTIFVCGTSRGIPATIAQTDHGNVILIRYTAHAYNVLNAQSYCELVSSRFQTFYNLGNLKYLTTGTINSVPIVCVAHHIGGGCAIDLPHNGILFSVAPYFDPKGRLELLESVRHRASGPLDLVSHPLEQYALTSKPYLENNSSRFYVDVKNLLDTDPSSASSNKQPRLVFPSFNPANSSETFSAW